MPTLPIRRVVLYKHGVGHFEREGTVSGSQAVTLTFKQREVSDVLKSLTVLDRDGGLVSAVGYESTTPVEQLLAEIALSIPDEGSLVGLLPQLKGAKVAVRPTGATTDEIGVLLGIDPIDTSTAAGHTKQFRLSILADSGEIHTFDLFDVAVKLLDDGLKRDLDFYLKTQLAAKKKDARTFTLLAEGEGNRTLVVSYLLEAPVWKATYRILLNEEGQKEPLVQGWAVVDNTSDEDWEDVHLTLVAGLPVSFVHDLYTPRFIKRPVVEVKETTGVLPPTVEAGFDSMMMEAESAAPGMALAAAPMQDIPKKWRAKNESITRGGSMMTRTAASSVQTQTRERQVGDLFEYAIERPVTVRRNQSALVPIVLKAFTGKPVLLYQKHARAENPIRCVEFENTTGLTLEGGPVTVLDSGSYAGEAMLDTLKPKEQRLIGYAVELAVRVTDRIDSHTSAVSRVVITGGTLITYAGQIQESVYTFASKSDAEQTVYLDHPRPAEWELTGTPKPHEVTDGFWRFKFTLPPNSQTRFVVKAGHPFSQAFHLLNTHEAQLAAWVANGYLDDSTSELIRAAFAVRAKVAELDEQISRLEQERAKLHEEQKRIRDNLTSLGDRTSEKDLRERYVRTLGKQEDRLEAIERERSAAINTRDEARQKLTDALNAVSMDRGVPA
ncbi:MAG: hypothetical protein MUF18_14360 [Fimbriiglobus sp.]|jgi:hypothetical protein|nr:hypothetical protein [Fimbriiglobus sp.]